jgi:hypothetical protein
MTTTPIKPMKMDENKSPEGSGGLEGIDVYEWEGGRYRGVRIDDMAP